MRDVNIPTPNPALAKILVSPQMRSVVQQHAEIAQALYRAGGSKQSGRTARDARVSTHIGGVRGDRWVGRLTVTQPTSLVAAVHDLRATLNQMAGQRRQR